MVLPWLMWEGIPPFLMFLPRIGFRNGAENRKLRQESAGKNVSSLTGNSVTGNEFFVKRWRIHLWVILNLWQDLIFFIILFGDYLFLKIIFNQKDIFVSSFFLSFYCILDCFCLSKSSPRYGSRLRKTTLDL